MCVLLAVLALAVAAPLRQRRQLDTPMSGDLTGYGTCPVIHYYHKIAKPECYSSNNVSILPHLILKKKGNLYDGYGNNDYGTGNIFSTQENQGFDSNNQQVPAYGGYQDFGGYDGGNWFG